MVYPSQQTMMVGETPMGLFSSSSQVCPPCTQIKKSGTYGPVLSTLCVLVHEFSSMCVCVLGDEWEGGRMGGGEGEYIMSFGYKSWNDTMAHSVCTYEFCTVLSWYLPRCVKRRNSFHTAWLQNSFHTAWLQLIWLQSGCVKTVVSLYTCCTNQLVLLTEQHMTCKVR